MMLLPHCRRLFLRDYEVTMFIGVHEVEKDRKQRVLINIDLYTPLRLSFPIQDQLSEVLDYDLMRHAIHDILSQNQHIHLQETLCDMLCNTLLAHPQVEAVRVSTEKPDIYPHCRAMGVEVFRYKFPQEPMK